MNMKSAFFALYIFAFFIGWTNCVAIDQQEELHTVLSQKITQSEPEKSKKRNKKIKKTISFDFPQGEDLVDIINLVAAQKDINIILPLTAQQNFNVKVNLRINELLTVDEAWDILNTLLDIAGYSIVPKGQNTYTIVKSSKEIIKESLPVYIATPAEDLPNNDERIRYIYYFTNLKMPDEQQGQNEIVGALSVILSENAFMKADSNTNGILIIDKANSIRGALDVITALDQTPYLEKMEVIKLRHIPADVVANLFNEQIMKTAADPNRYRPEPRKTSDTTYFSRQIKIIPYDGLNTLFILGRTQAVERVREFIYKYIDVELESGKSILHVYQLQYLDADKFAPILQRIVESSKTGGTEQSKTTSAPTTGTERYFEDVKIRADTTSVTTEGDGFNKFYGNNKLIVACRNDDWERIKKLIEQLDTPQRQVIIEVLVADLTLSDSRLLGTTFRNPLALPLAKNTNFQSAQLTPVVLNTNPSVAPPTTIQSDLLGEVFTNSAGATISAAGLASPGTTVIEVNDATTGQTWGLLEVQKLFQNSRVIHHPHVMATNNQKALIMVMDERLLIDDAAGSSGGATNATRKWIKAQIDVTITPRISSGNSVNLQVAVNINQFSSTDTTNGNRITRNVTTNANVGSGGILALGGLARTDTTDSLNQTPLLSKIPLIGWMFKSRSAQVVENNLTVFISPIIVEPRLRSGVSEYTKDYTKVASKYARDGRLFDSLRDPITRWFFNTAGPGDLEKEINDFVAKDEFIAPSLFFEKEEHTKIVNSKVKKQEPTNKRDEALENELKDKLQAIKNPFEVT